MPLEGMLSMAPLQNVIMMGVGTLDRLSLHRKQRRCWTFLASDGQVLCPRNMVLLTKGCKDDWKEVVHPEGQSHSRRGDEEAMTGLSAG